MEVAEAVSLSVDKLHFVVKAFCDSVVAGEAPHGHDFLGPGREGLAELDQGSQAGLAELVDGSQESRQQLEALLASAVLFQQQITEPLFEAVDTSSAG